MAIRNAHHKTGANSGAVSPPAFQERDVMARGKKGNSSRISRVGSTARVSGSGAANTGNQSG